MAKKKKSGNKETTLANILFVTALLDLIHAVVDFAHSLIKLLTG